MFRRSSHAVFDCRYHLIWATKRRRRALRREEERDYCKRLLGRVAEKYEMTILAIEVDEDHVHLYVEIPPQQSVGSAVRKFKSLSGRYLVRRFPYLRRHFYDGAVWSPSYFVRSIGEGVTAETVRRYIETHEGRANLESVQAELFPRPRAKPRKKAVTTWPGNSAAPGRGSPGACPGEESLRHHTLPTLFHTLLVRHHSLTTTLSPLSSALFHPTLFHPTPAPDSVPAEPAAGQPGVAGGIAARDARVPAIGVRAAGIRTEQISALVPGTVLGRLVAKSARAAVEAAAVVQSAEIRSGEDSRERRRTALQEWDTFGVGRALAGRAAQAGRGPGDSVDADSGRRVLPVCEDGGLAAGR